MKLSEMIEFLEKEKERVGDVEVHIVESDGPSSYVVPFYFYSLVNLVKWPSKQKLWYFGEY